MSGPAWGDQVIRVYFGESVGAAANSAVAAAASAATANVNALAAVAAAQGRIFASYSAGNAGTTAGQYFFVASGGALDLHINGTATPVAKLPTLTVADGRLGIGTATPGTLLEIEATGGAAAINLRETAQRLWAIRAGGSTLGALEIVDTTAGAVAWQFIGAAGHFRPGSDNGQNLGDAARRLAVVYAGTGAINTSDETEKTWRGAFTAPELAAAKDIAGAIGVFQWNAAIAEKGADPDAGGARLHFGVKAQQVWGIMAAHGLLDEIEEGADPDSKYAFLCWDDLGDGNGRFGVRPDQLALFLIAAQEARIAALEAA